MLSPTDCCCSYTSLVCVCILFQVYKCKTNSMAGFKLMTLKTSEESCVLTSMPQHLIQVNRFYFSYSSSPHSVLEKLLQKHVQAVNRQETVKVEALFFFLS